MLERLLTREALDRCFEATAQAQYTRDILFSSLVGLMLQIVFRTQASARAAYRHATIATSVRLFAFCGSGLPVLAPVGDR